VSDLRYRLKKTLNFFISPQIATIIYKCNCTKKMSIWNLLAALVAPNRQKLFNSKSGNFIHLKVGKKFLDTCSRFVDQNFSRVDTIID